MGQLTAITLCIGQMGILIVLLKHIDKRSSSILKHPQKLNVSMRIVQNRPIGPFFMDAILASDKYMNLLNNQNIPALDLNGQLPQNFDLNKIERRFCGCQFAKSMDWEERIAVSK